MYHTCVKAGKQLDETITVLEKVAAHTEKLAAYCLDIGERLADLQDLVEDLRSESINRSKMVALKHKWTAVKDAHSEYRAAVRIQNPLAIWGPRTNSISSWVHQKKQKKYKK